MNEKDVLPKNLIDLMMDLDSSESEEELEDETSESDYSDSDSINWTDLISNIWFFTSIHILFPEILLLCVGDRV